MRLSISGSALALFLAAGLCGRAAADEPSGEGWFGERGKLLATGGVSQVEGAGGGGLVPWALITGYESRDGVGVTVHETVLPTGDFTLHAPGIAVGLYDRVELSYAADLFTIDNENLAPGGLHKGYQLHQDVYGAKLRVAGDAVYGQDSLLPQIAVGLQYKRSDNGDVVKAVGARDSSGIDYYVAATKLFLDYSLLADVTLRFTKANQFGLLGFGSATGGDGYAPEFEGSLAYLFSRRFAVGVECRMKPSNDLKFAGVLPLEKEQAAFDIFAAYFFNKTVSLTAAFADLGKIADVRLDPLGIHQGLEPHDQRGAYASLQLAF